MSLTYEQRMRNRLAQWVGSKPMRDAINIAAEADAELSRLHAAYSHSQQQFVDSQAENERLRTQLEAAEADARSKLAAFGAWCAREFRDSLADVDGGSAQDAMERLGVIVKSVATEPCGEGCVCVEYGEFPHECFKFPADVVCAIDAALSATTPETDEEKR